MSSLAMATCFLSFFATPSTNIFVFAAVSTSGEPAIRLAGLIQPPKEVPSTAASVSITARPCAAALASLIL